MTKSKNNANSAVEIQDLVAYRINGLANIMLRSASRFYKAKLGLHPPEIWVLCSIGIHEPITAREVANRITIDEAQVSRAIKSLIEQDIINRQSSKEDNRRKMLSLSKKGKSLFQKATRFSQDRQARFLEGLSDEDIEHFKSILEIVGDNAQELLSNS